MGEQEKNIYNFSRQFKPKAYFLIMLLSPHSAIAFELNLSASHKKKTDTANFRKVSLKKKGKRFSFSIFWVKGVVSLWHNTLSVISVYLQTFVTFSLSCLHSYFPVTLKRRFTYIITTRRWLNTTSPILVNAIIKFCNLRKQYGNLLTDYKHYRYKYLIL